MHVCAFVRILKWSHFLISARPTQLALKVKGAEEGVQNQQIFLSLSSRLYSWLYIFCLYNK